MPREIRPAGGGDHATLADYVDWADGNWESPAHDAECYRGNLGQCFIAGFNTAPTSGNRLSIYAAAGEYGDGTRSVALGSTVAYIEINGSGEYGIVVLESYVTIRHITIRSVWDDQAMGINLGFGTGKEVDACVFVTSTSTPKSFISSLGFVGRSDFVITNNIMYWDGGDVSGTEASININSLLGQNISNFQIHNNTIDMTGGSGGVEYGIMLDIRSGGVLTGNITHNAFFGSKTKDFEFTGGGSNSATWEYNASQDASADDFDGTGNLINQTASDCFTTPGNDVTLIDGGNLHNAGGTTTNVEVDFLGVQRPQGSNVDIGAYEIQVASTTFEVSIGESVLCTLTANARLGAAGSAVESYGVGSSFQSRGDFRCRQTETLASTVAPLIRLDTVVSCSELIGISAAATGRANWQVELPEVVQFAPVAAGHQTSVGTLLEEIATAATVKSHAGFQVAQTETVAATVATSARANFEGTAAETVVAAAIGSAGTTLHATLLEAVTSTYACERLVIDLLAAPNAGRLFRVTYESRIVELASDIRIWPIPFEQRVFSI